MIKIPYGISNFGMLVKYGYKYIDRTIYIEELENLNPRYLVLVRPRRFGKSLFISLLEHYYGIQYKEDFEELFKSYYIGQHPTPSANKYLILKFDFSQMDTSSFENTYDSFLNNVKESALAFLRTYPEFSDAESIKEIKAYTFPAQIMQHLLRLMSYKSTNQMLYLLIDEYDHFANEILSFRFAEFDKMVGQNGFVRKFYEAIKVGTQSGIVDRLFITGVSPLTLDSFTSGFNMSTNISLYEEFNAIMGFKEAEVLEILADIEVPKEERREVLALMKKWYDGYLFAKEAKEQIYNSDMVLYFASQYSRSKQYPENLLDPNIASDYTKIRRLFTIKGKETEHLQYLDVLLKTGQISARLVRQFEIENRFDKHDFISLLYYTGILTIAGRGLINTLFRMPNYVIQQLYYQYFYQIILERSQLLSQQIDLSELVIPLALTQDLQPIITHTEQILTELSNRDKMNFDEKYLKVILTSILFAAGIYTIHNEFEVKKSKTAKGYVDILLLKRPPFETKFQFAIELKYLKKASASQLKTTKAEAISQLNNYLQQDDYLKKLKALKSYVVVFVGNEGHFWEVTT